MTPNSVLDQPVKWDDPDLIAIVRVIFLAEPGDLYWTVWRARGLVDRPGEVAKITDIVLPFTSVRRGIEWGDILNWARQDKVHATALGLHGPNTLGPQDSLICRYIELPA